MDSISLTEHSICWSDWWHESDWVLYWAESAALGRGMNAKDGYDCGTAGMPFAMKSALVLAEVSVESTGNGLAYESDSTGMSNVSECNLFWALDVHSGCELRAPIWLRLCHAAHTRIHSSRTTPRPMSTPYRPIFYSGSVWLSVWPLSGAHWPPPSLWHGFVTCKWFACERLVWRTTSLSGIATLATTEALLSTGEPLQNHYRTTDDALLMTILRWLGSTGRPEPNRAQQTHNIAVRTQLSLVVQHYSNDCIKSVSDCFQTVWTTAATLHQRRGRNRVEARLAR